MLNIDFLFFIIIDTSDDTSNSNNQQIKARLAGRDFQQTKKYFGNPRIAFAVLRNHWQSELYTIIF